MFNDSFMHAPGIARLWRIWSLLHNGCIGFHFLPIPLHFDSCHVVKCSFGLPVPLKDRRSRRGKKNNFSCNICLSNKLLVYDVCVVEAVWCNISGFIFLEKIFRFKFLCVCIEGFVNSFLCQGVPAFCETKQVYQPQSTLRFVTYNCDVVLGFRDPASSFFESSLPRGWTWWVFLG